jgi:hypothetical protein
MARHRTDAPGTGVIAEATSAAGELDVAYHRAV